jgi:thiol-disulfide isomerase/thioredoxin
VINGTVPGAYNGQWVYLFDYDQNLNLDSALVADGTFSFTGLPDATNYVRIQPSDRKLFANVIREAGVISVDLSDYKKISGTPLNDKWISYMTELQNLDEGDYETYEAINSKYLDANRNNAIGKLVFVSWYDMLSSEKVDSVYALLGENIKNQQGIQNIILANNKRKQTAEGMIFTDFTIANGNPDGSSVSFSDYIGKGKYVLVDFWASWCGPCIAENPTIAEVYKTHKSDKFDVLGVAVWDEREATKEAIRKHNIVWNQIIDAQKIPTDIYGIDGIPHLILFGPDGKILARNLRGDALKAKVAEVLRE